MANGLTLVTFKNLLRLAAKKVNNLQWNFVGEVEEVNEDGAEVTSSGPNRPAAAIGGGIVLVQWLYGTNFSSLLED